IYQDSVDTNANRLDFAPLKVMAELSKATILLDGTNEYDEALKLLIAIGKMPPIEKDRIVFLSSIHNALSIYGNCLDQRWQEAEKLLNPGNTLNKNAPTTEMELLLQEVLIYGNLNKPDKSVEAWQNYTTVKDSLFLESSIQSINAMETLYRMKERSDSIRFMAQTQELQAETIENQRLSKRYWQALAGGAGIAGISLLLLSLNINRGRKRARLDQQHIENLHLELDHRVKNNLHMLSSMIALQSAKEPDPDTKAALSATQTRIQALSILHNLLDARLAEREDSILITEYLPLLIAQLQKLQAKEMTDLTINTKIEPIRLGVGDSLALALILNEWLTNAFKYAVPVTEDPEIDIELSAIGADQVILKVSDNGPGFNPEHRREGSFGTDLVDTQVRQLRGDLVLDTDQGTTYRLSFRKNA
ncbi:MAG: sensor histidine kinase, partial [Bacteroidota bacterium]